MLFQGPSQGNHEESDMEKRRVDSQRAGVADHHSSEIVGPMNCSFHLSASLITTQCSSVPDGRLAAVRAVWSGQFDAAAGHLLAQRVTFVTPVSDEAFRPLSRPAQPMPPSYPDRPERRFRKSDLRPGLNAMAVS